MLHREKRGSSDGIVTRLRAGRPGFDSRQGQGIFLFAATNIPPVGPAQPPFQSILAAISRGVKLPGREADHSPPSITEVKDEWSYTSTSLSLHDVVLRYRIGFVAWYLYMSRDRCYGQGN
jgi:hypothetical protein